MAIREGRWDCPTCGTAGLLGRQVNCTQCGTPRPEGIRFYLPDDAVEVTDANLLRQARAGADWICEHCSASARAGDEHCPGCGAERGGSGAQATHDYAMGEVPRDGRKPERRALAAPPATRRKRAAWPVLFLAFIALVAWWNSPRQVAATVSSGAWERAIEVQSYRTVREEGWDVPSGGRTLRSFRAVRDYRQVLDHYETRTRQVSERVQVGTRTYTCGSRDLGNGHFEDKTCREPEYETRYHDETYREPIYRREPVYDTRFAYEIERWLPQDTAWARGDAAGAPAWPAVRIGERQREGARLETYRLRFKDGKGKSYEREVPLAQFTRYRPGQSVKLKMKRGGTGQVQIVEK